MKIVSCSKFRFDFAWSLSKENRRCWVKPRISVKHFGSFRSVRKSGKPMVPKNDNHNPLGWNRNEVRTVRNNRINCYLKWSPIPLRPQTRHFQDFPTNWYPGYSEYYRNLTGTLKHGTIQNDVGASFYVGTFDVALFERGSWCKLHSSSSARRH